MSKIGVYPGSFDPITVGHADLIQRALKVVDKLVIAIAVDNNKNSIFSIETKIEMVKAYLPEILTDQQQGSVEVLAFEGLLVKFAKSLGSNIIFRGIRAVNDFEYEFQLACVNSRLMNDVQTIFLPAAEQNQYISSRFVKEVARLGGDLSSFSCEFVIQKLKEHYQK
ncbi:pantetheine-phosphate adenylyltransferase [Rickettsiales endosymbiont of Stachyamoeba lipophora]|uniref:pantetheine-phosphate adenylyltransferase n=1 Tax=Rickettsiales endosymbiont of Stachyamoeba lipophora TaxID=2486578 RepID=UPI000F64A300|nr:pantetheine-phosphate adenylyltransferase [Rickettsiales endosymbiont of Stachyamoeba lipophora]AZL15962.1 pantetheine-phosphate adenylyltransferase [Rickettsiales endosymbiont of Stachyamoeba lipophora]